MAKTMRRFSIAGMAVALLAAGLVAALPGRSQAASQSVSIRDNNKFDPREVHIDPGDTVVWSNQGSKVHTVNADSGDFRSGDIRSGQTYQKTFSEEGYYDYFCRYHGAKGGVGMSGTVVVGTPPPRDDDGGGKDKRPTLVVPKEFPTIQKAVNAAKPGSTVLIRPGVYKEAVSVKTPRLIIRGVDRFRTILNGGDKKSNGFLIDGANNVRITNLTVRNYRSNGVFFNDVNGYKADHIDAIKNRTYGLYAFDSYNGVFRKSFGYGSGDSAFYIGECLGCGGLIEDVVAQYNFLGYSGTNATGVVIRDSIWKHNGAGIVPNTLPTEEHAPNRGTLIVNNIVKRNNYDGIPAAGFSETVNIPFGTGIWLAGVSNNVVQNNVIENHNAFGVLVSESIDANSLPMNNTVVDNRIRNSNADNDQFGWDLAWTGEGASNCFSGNKIKGETGPPQIQTVYACANRPFPGVTYAPVAAYVASSLCCPDTREQKDPPDPKRPRCQHGRAGCRGKH